MAIQTINPATEEVVKTFTPMDKKMIDAKLETAKIAFEDWKNKSFSERTKVLHAVAQNLTDNKQKYAQLMTLEMGKPIKQGIAEVEKCAWVCKYYADNAQLFLKEEFVETESTESYVRFDPLGIVLAIMPWNFPFWQVFRACAPILMAGNVMVLKHASNVPQCALAIEEIFNEAGAPKGIITTVLIEGKDTNAVIADERIVAVTLTGSEEAGQRVAEVAGANLKKQVLELGGSDPFIILADADLEQAATVAASARTINAGQSCIAAKRFIVEEKIADKFIEVFVAKMIELKVGDPSDETTQIGPLARVDLRDQLHEQVQESVKKGAKIKIGGKEIGDKGAYYEPTVLTQVQPGMPAYDDELFGPVATVIVVKDAQEAVQVANSHRYGLGSAIWTKDIDKAKELAAQIEAGAVFINDFVKSDPRLPFGGIKKSGYGRELGSYGIKEFVNIKTVVIK